jgi:alpha-tubulin suppressor-like RCC1 family protein
VVETRDSRNEVKALQLVYSMAAVGFSAAPHLEFSNIPGHSKGLVTYKQEASPLISLFSAKVLKQLKNLNVKIVSCGYEHAAVVTVDGKVLTWGYGASGCLGHESKKSYSHPTAINSIFNKNIVHLECGAYHTAAVSAAGELWTWGRGDVGQLGLPNEKLLKDEVGLCALRPTRVKWLKAVCAAACGEAHTLVLTCDGRVVPFGWDEDGQLGLQNGEKEVALKNKTVKVAAGALFSVALLETGEVMVWGSGEMGQLGLGNANTFVRSPCKVPGVADVVDVVCGENSVVAVSRTGKLWAWGQGTVSTFTDSKVFPSGSDIVCFLPHPLCEVDIVHKVLVKKKKVV